MLDLTNAIEEINYYKGSEKKKTLIYNNNKYLIIFFLIGVLFMLMKFIL